MDSTASHASEVPRLIRWTVLLAVLVLAGLAGPSTAGAAGIEPCTAASPTGAIVTLDGEATLQIKRAGRRMLRRASVKRKLVRPANAVTGWPTFPVRKVRFGKVSRIWLKGGIRFQRGKRKAVARGMIAIVPQDRRKVARVTARLGGRKLVLFRLSGGRRVIRDARGEIDLGNAKSRLGGNAVKLLNRRLGLMKRKKRKRLSAKVKLGRFDLNATYFKVRPDDPVAENPEEPPVAVEPEGATRVVGASIDWELRDSWIDYVNTGEAPKTAGGAEAGPRKGSKNLVYSYTFPFSSGWTAAQQGAAGDSTLIRGGGSLAFRFCEHTINFMVAEPEIELSDDDRSRMIFRVDGTDGTAFPNQRAVMVKLRPSAAESHTVTEGEGAVTETWKKIPGYVPAEGTGIFADFYPAYDPQFGAPGAGFTETTRPDRFGFLTVSYTYPAVAP